MKFFTFFVLMVALYEVNALNRRSCGNLLVQVLDTICPGGFNQMPSKRSVYGDSDLMAMYKDVADSDTSVLFDDHVVGEHAKNRRRRDFLGIYEECCVRECSLNQIAAYCD